MQIAIYGSRHQHEYLGILSDFMQQLQQRGIEVVMHPKLYQYLLHSIPAALAAVRLVKEQLDCDPAIVLSIGGDGTFLRTVQWVDGRDLPILGVNTGHLGFLTALSIHDLPGLLDSLDHGDFVPERRSLLRLRSPRLPIGCRALNEITVAKEANASMITATTDVNGRHLCDYRADGLIVATPTGSTAYSLSVGGPIVMPDTPAMILSPIAAHSLSVRPLVVSDSSVIGIEVHGRAERFRLSIDGRSIALDMGTRIEIDLAPEPVTVLRHRDHGFASVLNQKLGWE